MVDLSFYDNKGPFTLECISNRIGCDLHGDKNKIIKDISTIEHANSSEICFLVSKYKQYFNTSKAGAFITNYKEELDGKKNIIFSSNPHFDMAKVASLFYPDTEYPSFFFQKNIN